MSDTETFEGGCFCGAITVAVRGGPTAAGLCHCESCRKWHSAPINAWAIWPDASVEVTQGRELLVEYNQQGPDGPSGRTSCGRCGGALFNRKPKVGMTVVYAMTLDGSGLAFEPTFHCYYGEGVLHVADGLPKYEGLPQNLGGSGRRIDEPPLTSVRR